MEKENIFSKKGFKKAKLKNFVFFKILIFIFFNVLSLNVSAERIKDLATIFGVRSNQLIGYGLVVGLDGSGDNADFTDQSFKTMLTKLGINLPANIKSRAKNVAAVAIHSELPAFARPGNQIDVTVSSIGNAKSLRGGTLLLSPLKGVDGKIYALAQGNLVVSGITAQGINNSKIKINVPVVGRIPNGGTIEVASPATFSKEKNLTFLLNRPDFTTAKRMSEAINYYMGKGTAEPHDAGSVIVKVPESSGDRVRFISALENLTLDPGEASAKVIVNAKSGTIIIGKNVVVGPAAITHGDLSITISEEESVSQPMPSSFGKTTKINRSDIEILQENSKVILLKKGVLLEDIVSGINKLGTDPGDLIAILDALKKAGALTADLEII